MTFELRGERGSVSIAGAGPRSIVAIDGEVLLRGHAAATEWSTLANVAAVGDEHVDVLTASLDGWDVGDEIIISGTTFGGDASTHETRYISSIHENHGECSQFSVVPCQSYARVNFTDADGKPAPLNFTHVSKTHTSQSKQIDARAVVARLTRNVRVVGVESTSNRFGAAVAIQRGSARISGVEFTRAGQSSAAGNPSIGPRHPISLFGDSIDPTSYIKGCSVHRAWNRGIVVLSSAAVSISDNVIFDTHGHSYHVATSPGSLIPPASNILRNVGIFAQAHGSGLPSDSTPAVFRLNPGTGIVSGNRACGSESHGFWIGFDVLDVGAGDPKFTSPWRQAHLTITRPIHPQVPDFSCLSWIPVPMAIYQVRELRQHWQAASPGVTPRVG